MLPLYRDIETGWQHIHPTTTTFAGTHSVLTSSKGVVRVTSLHSPYVFSFTPFSFSLFFFSYSVYPLFHHCFPTETRSVPQSTSVVRPDPPVSSFLPSGGCGLRGGLEGAGPGDSETHKEEGPDTRRRRKEEEGTGPPKEVTCQLRVNTRPRRTL